MDKKTKNIIFIIAFGVVMYAAAMNLGAVLAFAGKLVSLLLPLIIGLVLSAVVFGLFAGIRMGAIGLTYGLDALTAPAHSLVQFGQSDLNLPIWLTIIGWLLSQWLVFGLVSVLVCLLTQKMNMVGSMMMGVVVSMGTSVLNLVGLPAPTIWNLLEGPSLFKCCAIVALMAAGWYMTVRLWSGNGRKGS